MTSSEPLLEIEHLNLGFRMFEGKSSVLRDVSLSIAPGERVALVGESGCGKSILLRTVLGLHNRRVVDVSGEITFDAERLDRFSERQFYALRGGKISMIFQDPTTALNPVFRIGEQFRDIILKHRTVATRAAADKLAAEMLRSVYIDDPERVLASYPFQLSGGMNQRVMITIALVNRPKLVLADEPGTALDVTVQEQTLQLMREATETSGTAVLLVTHNLGVVRRFADRVYVMYGGMIVEEAPVAELFSSPRHPYSKALLAAVPRLSGNVLPEPIEGMVPDFTRPPPGCRFHPRCAFAIDRCRLPPPVVRVSPGHDVACVLYDEA
ncbi:MAG: ABC transporter ATP-binding protein [Rhizobiaceae bacterium]